MHRRTCTRSTRPNKCSKLSEYGLQLAEKQTLFYDGENNSVTLFYKLIKLKAKLSVSTCVLERRLITLLTVWDLRLLVVKLNSLNHGHILLTENALISFIPRNPGQVISAREKSQSSSYPEAVEATVGRPAFVSFDADKLEGSLTRPRTRNQSRNQRSTCRWISTTKCS